jgi:hypothetical protein
MFIVPLSGILRDSMEIGRNFKIYVQKCWLRLITRNVFPFFKYIEDLRESKGSAPRIHTVDTSWSIVIIFRTVTEHPVVLPCGQKARRAHVYLKSVAKTIFCAIGA